MQDSFIYNLLPIHQFFNFFCLYLLISFVSLRKSFFVIICVICIWFSTFLADFMRFFLEKHFIICSSSSVIRLFIIIWPEINKTFIGPVVKPHLDYADVIYDRAFNESFHQRLESIQYNAAITITGTIRGTSSEKLLEELGLETLKSRRWFRKLFSFYKILHGKSPSYLFNTRKQQPICFMKCS